ncbi:hypothetical protein SteCoe_11348 [Stentor coeruleus]|uniref:Uncharacterized protein n=1 Tax=Stentor coeruleus TaxID=5963 RepID=A0A1R2CDJ0_9CILI|nr:hypothetical protein SteCoe_11348 [Stentor coeruleus]
MGNKHPGSKYLNLGAKSDLTLPFMVSYQSYPKNILQETFSGKVSYAFFSAEKMDDVREGLLSQFNLDYGYCGNSIHLLKLSQDSTLIMALSKYWIRIHSYKDKNIIKALKSRAQIESIEMTYDNQWVFYMTKEGIYTWNQITNECIFVVIINDIELKCFSLQKKYKLLAFGLNNGKVCLWNFFKKKFKCEFLGHKSSVSCLGFANDNFLVSGGGFFKDIFDPIIRIWDIKKRNLVCILKGHGLSILQLTFIEDEDKLISLSNDYTIRIWDIKKAIEYADKLELGNENELKSKDYSNSDEAVKLINDIKDYYMPKEAQEILLVNYHNQCKSYLSKIMSDMKSPYEISCFCIPKRDWNYSKSKSMYFMIDKSTQTLFLKEPSKKTISLYNYNTWKLQSKIKNIKNEEISNLCLNLQNSSLIYSYRSEFFYEINIKTKSCVLTPIPSSILNHAYSSITRECILLSIFYSLPGPIFYFTIWDLSTQKYIGIFKSGTSEIKCLDISLDKKSCLVSTEDLKIRIWDIESKTIKAVLDDEIGDHTLALSNDGRFCCMLDRRTFSVRDIISKQELCTIYEMQQLGVYMIPEPNSGNKYLVNLHEQEINMIHLNCDEVNKYDAKRFTISNSKKYLVAVFMKTHYFHVARLRVLPKVSYSRII